MRAEDVRPAWRDFLGGILSAIGLAVGSLLVATFTDFLTMARERPSTFALAAALFFASGYVVAWVVGTARNRRERERRASERDRSDARWLLSFSPAQCRILVDALDAEARGKTVSYRDHGPEAADVCHLATHGVLRKVRTWRSNGEWAAYAVEAMPRPMALAHIDELRDLSDDPDGAKRKALAKRAV